MARWVLDDDAQPHPDHYFLAALADDRIVGNLTIRVQNLVVPGTAWSAGRDHTLTDPDGFPLRETFVATFAVDEAHRRRGYGRALQLAALDLTRDLGCYQLRSWSSLDKPANYALKLSLGFAIHPAIQEAHTGQQISGVYFVRTV